MDLYERARIHEALGDPHRLEIVDALVGSDRSPGHLAEVTGMAPNLVAHHLRVLEGAGVVEVRRSEGDGRRRYVHLLAAGVAAVGGAEPVDRPVVFVCTHNSARSQLAAALWSRASGESATSAGTHPAERVHPKAVAVGGAHGLDLRGATPRLLEPDRVPDAVVVTVCDRAAEELAEPPDRHWSVPDPVAVGTDDAFNAAFEALVDWVERTQTREEES